MDPQNKNSDNILKVDDLMERVEDSTVQAACIQNGNDPNAYIESFEEYSTEEEEK